MTFSIQRIHLIFGALFAGVLSIGMWTFAQAEGTEISMCVKQSGASYVIGTGFANQECKSNEQLLTFNVTGPQGPQGIQGPIGPQGPMGPGVALFDANDEVVAYVVEGFAGSQMIVYDPVLKIMLSADTLTGGVSGGTGFSATPFFTTNDCSGTAYVVTDNVSEIPIKISSNLFDSFFVSGDAIRDYSLPILTNQIYGSYGSAETNCITLPMPTQYAAGVPMKSAEGLLYSDLHPGPFHLGIPEM